MISTQSLKNAVLRLFHFQKWYLEKWKSTEKRMISSGEQIREIFRGRSRRFGEQDLLATIHLLPLGQRTSARREYRGSPFAFESCTAFLVAFSGFFLMRNDRGILKLSCGRTRIAHITLQLENEPQSCDTLINCPAPAYQWILSVNDVT